VCEAATVSYNAFRRLSYMNRKALITLLYITLEYDPQQTRSDDMRIVLVCLLHVQPNVDVSILD
jgi:hypothetical protein